MMSSRARTPRLLISRVVFLSAGFLICAIVAAFIFGRGYLGSYLARQITARGQIHGLNVALRDPYVDHRGFSAASLDLFLPRALLSFSAGNLRLTPAYLHLLRGVFQATLHASVYGGILSADVGQNDSGGVSVTGDLRELDLADHPQFAGLGVTEGRLTVHTEDLAFHHGSFPSKGSFSLEVAGLSKPRASMLPGDVFVPAIENLSFFVRGSAGADSLSFNEISLTSSFGTALGTATIRHATKGAVVSFELALAIDLSEEGSKVVGSFLPSLSDGRIGRDSRHFRFEMTGDRGRVEMRFLPPP